MSESDINRGEVVEAPPTKRPWVLELPEPFMTAFLASLTEEDLRRIVRQEIEAAFQRRDLYAQTERLKAEFDRQLRRR